MKPVHVLLANVDQCLCVPCIGSLADRLEALVSMVAVNSL